MESRRGHSTVPGCQSGAKAEMAGAYVWKRWALPAAVPPLVRVDCEDSVRDAGVNKRGAER